MIELSILKLFTKDRSIYNKYIDRISKIALEQEIKNILSLIKRYYSCFEEHEYISKDELIAFYKAEYPLHKEKEQNTHTQLIDNVYDLAVSREMATTLIDQVIEKDYANDIVQAMLPVAMGQRRGDGFLDIRSILDDFADLRSAEDEDESPFDESSLDDILAQTESDGLQWRLKCLRTGLGPLTGETLGHVFARPETGKTSFLHSEVTFLAPQLGNGDLILWFNNEEPASKVKLRWYCASSDMSEREVRQDSAKAKHMFMENGGARIKLVDEAHISVEMVEQLCREYRPRFVVIDQGDKLTYKGDAKAGNGADRLKGIYDNLREVVKRCNKEWKMDILTVGQADKDAENKKKLFLTNLDGGKTGKAGAFDYVIGVGAEIGKDDVRYISFCKNKLRGYHGTHMVAFDRFKGRYSD